jgi:hypothetical protein
LEIIVTDKVQPQDRGFFRSIYDGAIEGDFSDNPTLTKRATQIGVGFIPVVGQIADARDTAAAIRDVRNGRPDGWVNLGLSVVGWLPFVGDLLKNSRKVGKQASIVDISGAIKSARQSWREIAEIDEPKLGTFKGWFYQPKIEMGVRGLPRDTNGLTNMWGDIQISKRLSKKESLITLDHELIHSGLSPKFIVGQELRAKVATFGYFSSHLLRRTEEGLAEGWAQFKREGVSGFLKGWNFPYESDYGLDPARVKLEAGALFGATAVGMAGAAALGASQAANDDQ